MTSVIARREELADIPFIDLQAQRRRLGDRIDQAIGRVLAHGKYVLGPEVQELEARLAAFTGAKHAVTCASGTDALLLPLMAEGVGRGDAVFVPSFTFVATAEVAALCGATPVFVDVLPDSFNMDPASLEAAIAEAARQGLAPRAVIPVDLFGQPADYPRIESIAASHGLLVIADAAQSFGAMLGGRRVGTFGDYSGTSFFPAKPLGCYGDGGAIFTDDAERAERLRSIRVHGKGTDKYDNVRVGINSRLDTIQASILLEKLAIFEDELGERERVAARYNAGLGGVMTVPEVVEGSTSVWAQYVVRAPNRDAVSAALRAAGVPTAIYYPLPMTRQTGYRDCPVAPDGAPVSERLSAEVFSLPMHPYLDTDTQDRIIDEAVDAVGA